MNTEIQQEDHSSTWQKSIFIKILMLGWMIAILFVYLTMFGPPEFWELLEKIGLLPWFNNRYNEFFPFFAQLGSCNSFPRLICR